MSLPVSVAVMHAAGHGYASDNPKEAVIIISLMIIAAVVIYFISRKEK